MAKKGQRKARFLTDSMVERAGEGTHFDAARTGLFLLVRNGHKNWYQSIAIHGRRTKIGIGNCYLVSAEEARRKAVRNREIAKAGGDPRDGKVVIQPQAPRYDSGKPDIPTFAAMAERVIGLKRPGWKNPEKMAHTWFSTLERYAYPVIGEKPLDQISRHDVKSILEPHWTEINASMKQLRQRISEIFKIAIADELVTDNPASDEILKALPRVNGNTEHLLALPHDKVKEAIRKIRKNKRYIGTRLCLEFAILTACRHHQAREIEWQDIDMEKGIWIAPAGKMKMKQEHRIPLSKAAMSVLKKAQKLGLGIRKTGLVFPSQTGKVIQSAVLSAPLKDEAIESTIHGFRTSFDTWANENSFNADAIEVSLSHDIPGVRGAYMRGEFMEQRKEIMEKWGEYIT